MAGAGNSVGSSQHNVVREAYSATLRGDQTCCVSSVSDKADTMGYSAEDRAIAQGTGTDTGLGCGNPISLAQLRPGETVVDLGCGAGLNCILAARAVGPTGQVIGVDMTRRQSAVPGRRRERRASRASRHSG